MSGQRLLHHFSEIGDITVFEPRSPVVQPSRPKDQEWLNGPLVWAIDTKRQPMYLFPRDCPRILVWPLATTTAGDLNVHWTDPSKRMIAYVEEDWSDRIKTAVLYRYDFEPGSFRSLDDAGMWVSAERVVPSRVVRVSNLPAALKRRKVDLRSLPDLTVLRELWQTSLHVSGIRLRNARNWTDQ